MKKPKKGRIPGHHGGSLLYVADLLGPCPHIKILNRGGSLKICDQEITQIDRLIDSEIDRQKDRHIERQTYRQIDRQIDRKINRQIARFISSK